MANHSVAWLLISLTNSRLMTLLTQRHRVRKQSALIHSFNCKKHYAKLPGTITEEYTYG